MSNKPAKKVRFYETNVLDQVGIFKSARYTAPSELINNIKTTTNQNTTMNVNVKQQIQNRNLTLPGKLMGPSMVSSPIRDACMVRETEGRFDFTPFKQHNVFYDKSFGYRQDSRYSNKSYE
jgi:hypothetical protein